MSISSREFVIWLRGFMEACNDLTATPAQWDQIKSELDRVVDKQHEYNNPDFGYTKNGVWCDKKGNWHYINYKDGFGYYENSEEQSQNKTLLNG